jgi:hypothetical protein
VRTRVALAAAVRRSGSARARGIGALAASYSLCSLVMGASTIAGGARNSAMNLDYDSGMAVWANGWVAHALVHLHSPLFSTQLDVPHGFNLLANTTSFALALLFVPVTVLFGAVASFNLQLLVLPVASALAMAWALRPWLASWWALWLSGLLWGFSMNVLSQAGAGWTNFVYLLTPPVVLRLLGDLWFTQRWSARRIGVALSVCVLVQLLVGAEVLVITALATSAAVAVVVLGASLGRRCVVRANARRTLEAGLWCLGASALGVAPVVAYMVAGPQGLPRWVWSPSLLELSNVPWASYVSHSLVARAHAVGGPPMASASYLGWGLLAALAVAVVLAGRRRLVWLAAGIAALGVWLARGPFALGHPWSLLRELPAVRDVGASRCVLLVWFGVAVVAGVGLDAVIERSRRSRVRPARWVLPALFVALAVVQLATAASTSVRAPSQRYRPVAALAAISRREPRAVVYAYRRVIGAMVQQSFEGFAFSLDSVSGPYSEIGSPLERRAWAVIAETRRPRPSVLTVRQLAELAAAFRYWDTTDIVVPTPVRHPDADQRGFEGFVTAVVQLYGAPVRIGRSWVWHVVGVAPRERVLSASQWRHCDRTVYRARPADLVGCVLRALGPPSGYASKR